VESRKEVKATCERLERASAKISSRRKVRDKQDEVMKQRALHDLGRCVYGPRGAWILAVRAAGDGKGKGESYRPVAPDEATFSFDWELVHVDPAGKEVRGDVRGTTVKYGALIRAIEIKGAHDLDGDGVAELFFTREYANTEESQETPAILRAQGGRIEPYPGVDASALLEIRDADGDGRADLVLQSPYHLEGPCGLDGQHFYGPRVLAHTKPDGTFSREDAWARAFVRDQCPDDPTGPLLVLEPSGQPDPQIDGEATVRKIACASFWGLSAELIQSKIRQEFPRKEGADGGEDSGCVPLKMLLTLPEKAPPFVLDGCPGR
jgi:hypothetical protein